MVGVVVLDLINLNLSVSLQILLIKLRCAVNVNMSLCWQKHVQKQPYDEPKNNEIFWDILRYCTNHL